MKSVLIVAVLILVINAAGTRANPVVGDMTGDNDGGLVNTDLGMKRRNVEERRWPGGVIPFRFDSSFVRKEKRMVRKAMRIWSKYTCLSFRPYRSGDTNFVVFRDGEGCSSDVGMHIGQQAIMLQKDECRVMSTVLHELGQAIGVTHTQNSETDSLSFGDLKMVNTMYTCTPSSCNLKDSDCTGNRYVGASCTCLCPGPSKDQLTQPCPAAAPTAAPPTDEEDYPYGPEAYPVTPFSDDYPYGPEAYPVTPFSEDEPLNFY